MIRTLTARLVPVFLVLTHLSPAHCQPSADRKVAMEKLSFMRGVWAGPASGRNPDGTTYEVHQTERMGPMLNGDIIVVEGRGYKKDGTVGFNAFGVVSWSPGTKKYELRSYAMGMAGTFDLEPTASGYVWTVPAGKGTLRYTATVTKDHWKEIGEYMAPGQPPSKTFEMNLKKVSDTDWPEGTPIPASAGK